MNSNLIDRHNEDARFDRVIDLTEHPERYSDEQIAEILSDPESREIYNLLCKTGSAMQTGETLSEAEVDKEWERFAASHCESRSSRKPRILPFRLGSRAASIAIVALTSLAAVAIGVAVTATLTPSQPQAEAAIEATESTPAVSIAAPAVTEPDDSTATAPSPILFEEATLETITDALAQAYGITVRFDNAEAKNLHLYYKFNPALPLEEVIDQLNTFEQISLRLNGKTLIVE